MIVASRMNCAALTPSRCGLALHQRPQGLGEADGGGSHRHGRNRTSDCASAIAWVKITTRRKRCNPGNATGPTTFVPSMVGAPTFETIYTEHAAEVQRAAFSILRDPALAEDVVQEVFERVWRGSGHDERRGPLAPYLIMLARSRALDLRRRSRTGERILHRLGEQAGALRSTLAATGRRLRARGRAPARARGGAAPARRAAPGDRPRLLGRPLGARAGRGRGHPLRHGEDAASAWGSPSSRATPSWRPHSGSGSATVRLTVPRVSYKQVSQPTSLAPTVWSMNRT